MDFSNLGLFKLITSRIDWLSQRQEVLAGNIANADTPGYRPLDLNPFSDHLSRAGGSSPGMAATHVGHLQPQPGRATQSSGTDRIDDIYEASPTGNEVILEQQLIRVSETAMQHQLALNLYRKHAGMIRTALGRGA
jgi:flagellar basal-body rod protein FlgB